mgnify:CR=1 FL=1|tara:strand:- start:405 stop:860 length:456 start_codon:yes stop_codon:yes gene_type:complete
MADLKISGRTKVDSFYKKFENMYPYLNPALFYPKDIGGGEVNTASTIANARGKALRQDLNGYTPSGESNINVVPSMSLTKFQNEITKSFHIVCSVNCRIADEKGKVSWKAIGSTKYGKMTIGDANAALQKDNAEKVTEERTKGTNTGSTYL